MTRIYFCTIILFLGLTFIINEGFTQCLTCGGGAGSGYIGQTNSLGLTTNSFIAGRNATITGNNSAIIGSYSTNNGSSSYILGSNSIIDPGCLSSFALGVNCNIRNTMSLLLGYNLKTSTGNSMAIGLGKGIGNELLTTVQI